MSQPAVILTELDGALGILPTTAGRLFAVVGNSSQGPLDTPAAYARITDLIADFGYGRAVEAAAHYIEKYGRPVVFVRTGQTVAASETAIVFTGSGTSVVTVDAATNARDDFEIVFLVVAGGTVGTTGITFKYSLDGGKTYSAVQSLGTAMSYIVPDSGGLQLNFAAGTLVAGDTATTRTTAAQWDTTEIGTALDALFQSSYAWEIAHIVGDIDGAAFDAIDPKFTGAVASGKFRSWYGSARIPTIAESEATYLAALAAIFNAKATKHGAICAGACRLISSVSGRQYLRPISHVVAAREQSVSEEINIADVNLGSLPGVSIRDANGNPDNHDESINPGLDDARFTVLRTWDDIQGVYVNRPRILSATGSDFDIYPKRRVLNIAHAALRLYFIRRLNKPILVDRATGFILESEALEIEAGARAAMRSVLLAKPKASAIEFSLSRTDNILSTKTLTGTARVIPLAYPEFIDLEVGFVNPALQVQAV
jgi:hypothetical protein